MPLIPKLSPYTRHKMRWEHCNLCHLCTSRSKVVLLRGTLPCKYLFVGEAPGVSEDVLGKPFVGPAGKLLDNIIKDTPIRYSSFAMTNLVGCIPLDGEGAKTAEPSEASIEACKPRLDEIISIARPIGVICVGKLAMKYVRVPVGVKVCEIIHPAAILRADISNKGLLIQRTAVVLREFWDDLEEIPF